MTQTDEITIAWAAGLFDGEGMILINKSRVVARIEMTDLDLIERMQAAFGGAIYKPVKRKDNWKQSWIWQLSTKESLLFLDMIYKHLGVRRKEKVDKARIAAKDNKTIKAEKLKQAILSYADSGLTQKQIGDLVGCCREHVNKTLRQLK